MNRQHSIRKKSPFPSEAQEQVGLFNWAAQMANLGVYPELYWMYHVPNGGKRNAIEGARFKAQGVKAGVPDICLPVPKGRYHGLYIELKRRDGGTVAKSQSDYIRALRTFGYRAEICAGAQEAMDVIENYLRSKESGHE